MPLWELSDSTTHENIHWQFLLIREREQEHWQRRSRTCCAFYSIPASFNSLKHLNTHFEQIMGASKTCKTLSSKNAMMAQSSLLSWTQTLTGTKWVLGSDPDTRGQFIFFSQYRWINDTIHIVILHFIRTSVYILTYQPSVQHSNPDTPCSASRPEWACHLQYHWH